MITSTGAPPPDDEPSGPPRRLPGWLPWAAAGAVALAVVLLGIALLSNDRSGTQDASGRQTSSGAPSVATTRASSQPSEEATSTPSAEATTSSPPSASPSDDLIRVDAADYVGRPKDDAKSDLKDLGFEVDDTTVDNPGDAEEDTVADVSPTGLVAPGSTITLSVYDEPVSEAPTPSDNGDDGGQGSGDDGGSNGGKGNGGGNGPGNGGGNSGGNSGKGKGNG